ncbi:protein FAM47E [Ochotona curzoniae]|uniref:protein FAM47E n=1 Tax=Ochotona curzoniae TaxID=130825 RepID=UPI001B351F87|nr:protein FAM47E [Ochotona curzoniae]
MDYNGNEPTTHVRFPWDSNNTLALSGTCRQFGSLIPFDDEPSFARGYNPNLLPFPRQAHRAAGLGPCGAGAWAAQGLDEASPGRSLRSGLPATGAKAAQTPEPVTPRRSAGGRGHELQVRVSALGLVWGTTPGPCWGVRISRFAGAGSRVSCGGEMIRNVLREPSECPVITGPLCSSHPVGTDRKVPVPQVKRPAKSSARCKEKLPFRHKTGLERPNFLNGQRWVFLRPGPKGSFPPGSHRKVPGALKAQPGEVKASLTPHPLALYPDLRGTMPAELFVQVLEVLDPERKLGDMWASCEDTSKRAEEPRKLLKKRCTKVHPGAPKKTPASHSGQWFPEEKSSEMETLHDDRPLLQESARQAVSDFCNWLATLGNLNIDEEFILKQFDVDILSRPNSDVLRVMSPSQVPPELWCRVSLRKGPQPELFQKPNEKRKPPKAQNPCKLKRVKMRYGAWYLNTKLWKKHKADEPLLDPKVSQQAPDENPERKLQEQEERLAELQGTAAFRDFILRRGYRMPSFLAKIYAGKKGNCGTPIKPSQG